MTRALAIALALGAASCAPAVNFMDPQGPRYAGESEPRADLEPDALRIVTFNIAYGRRYERAITCFADPPLREADIVLVQEMHASAVDAMAKALAMHYVYYPSSVRPGEKDMGTGILSRWPFESTEKLILPHTTRVMHRGRTAAIGTIRTEGVAVRVYSLHLGSPFGLSGGKRGQQAQAVLEHARQWDGPVIVGGDLNSKSVGKRFQAAGYRWVTQSVGKTVGPFSFDHIYVRGLGSSSEAGVGHTCRGASDHFPVWARLPAQPR